VGEDISCGCAYIVDGRCYWCGALESRLGAIDAMLEERQRAREQRERANPRESRGTAAAVANFALGAQWHAREWLAGRRGSFRPGFRDAYEELTPRGFGVLVPCIVRDRVGLVLGKVPVRGGPAVRDWMYSGTSAGEPVGPFLAASMFRALCEYSASTIARCWPAPR
jgi:hypothetical protein